MKKLLIKLGILKAHPVIIFRDEKYRITKVIMNKETIFEIKEVTNNG